MRYTCTVKPTLYSKQHRWETDIPVSELPAWLDRQPDTVIESGQVNLYLRSSCRDQNGKIGLIPYLDIEVEGHHDSIKGNIRAAQDAHMWLCEYGLDADLRVIATGQGFRFCWPFLIPYQYTSAFKDLVHDIPHAEEIKPQSFLRIAGYRGNTAQGKEHYMDASTRLLDDPTDMMMMQPEDYKTLVSGKLTKVEAQTILSAVMPTESIPDVWLLMLQDYQRRRKLKNCAIRLPKRQQHGSYLPQIFGELHGRGIMYREIKSGIYRLSECPICGRRNTNPFVTASGRVKCWTTNCDAGQRDDRGSLIGLRPDQWIEGLVEPAAAEEESTDRHKTTVDQSRQMIREAVESCSDVAVRITPGAGKTQTTLQSILKECLNRTVVYAEPTLAKADELLSTAKALPEAAGVNISLIRGRTGGSPENNYKDQNCYRSREAHKVARKGFSPGYIVCPKCAHREDCPYWNQFDALDQPGLVITTHAQAAGLPPVDDVIFDEDPENTLLKSETVRFDDIQWFRVGGGPLVKSFFSKLDKLMEEQSDIAAQTKTGAVIQHVPPEPNQAAIFSAAKVTGEEIEAVKRHIAAYQQFMGETHAKYHRRLYEDQVNMRALNWLLVALDELDGRACIKVSHKGHCSMDYTMMRRVKPEGRIIVLDATLFPPALERIFGRPFKLIESEVDLAGIKTIHFKRGFGKTKTRHMSQSEIERLLKRSIDELPASSRKILVCTWKGIENTVKAAAQKVFPQHEIETIHFMESRGLNKYSDHDAAILFGTFFINPIESGKRAELLFPDDPQLQEKYRRNLSDAENIQSVHRVRPIRGNKTLIVYGREWTTGVPGPDVVSDLRPGGADALEEAYQRAEAFYRKHGFFYRHIGWLLGIGHHGERQQVESYQKVDNLPVFCLIEDILYSKTPEKNRLLILNDRHYYDRIIEKLREKYPHAPEIQTTQTAKGNPAHGIGRLKAVQNFMERIGTIASYDRSKWLEIPVAPPTLPKPELQPELELATAGEVVVTEAGAYYVASDNHKPPG